MIAEYKDGRGEENGNRERKYSQPRAEHKSSQENMNLGESVFEIIGGADNGPVVKADDSGQQNNMNIEGKQTQLGAEDESEMIPEIIEIKPTVIPWVNPHLP